MKLTFNGRVMKWETFAGYGEWPADCNVRNELDDSRKLGDRTQVVYAMTGNRYDKIPYMPRRFPEGIFNIVSVIEKPPEDTYKWPFFISTDAWQVVTAWSLEGGGGYLRPTNKKVIDYGYGIHFSSSKTTLGCIRIINEIDLRFCVNLLQKEIDTKTKSTITVKYI